MYGLKRFIALAFRTNPRTILKKLKKQKKKSTTTTIDFAVRGKRLSCVIHTLLFYDSAAWSSVQISRVIVDTPPKVYVMLVP